MVMLKEPGLDYILEHTKTEDRGNYGNLRLQKMMEDSIRAMAALVKRRDAYTSDHQQRVARLASAIATELDCPDDQIRGLNLASSIHDVGKLIIPFEILSKPGKLNNIEFNIVKEHPKVAHDILANMEFYWPVSQMVVQHHERLDGSGYPAGLKGDAILPEARILAIADVMEAMSFDRPYRPALGIEVALEEISTQRGILFDADVVDASLKLFREKGYKLG
jgi:HD-GYP domain-containing protein (c-di-GMP phosphodiesterase class II)